MKIVYDTREKLEAIQPILENFENLGIETERRKLDVGDYANADDLEKGERCIIIDRKGGGLSEMALDLGRDFVRFKKEILRARKNKVLLVILIADDTRTCLADIKTWEPPYNTRGNKKAITGEKLHKTIITLASAYRDCLHVEFVKPDEMADRIVDLLNY